MDYSKITADPVTGPEIGRLYMEASGHVTMATRMAYRSFANQVERQFRELPVLVRFQEDDPYESAGQMFADVRRGVLKVFGTTVDQFHPLMTPHENNMFRAVHDFHGHYMTGRGFDRHGEEAAWVRHSQMFTGLARDAMTTETRGQSSAFIWINGGREFPEQKAVLLPSWVSRIPERWTV
jgi:hypothetical protein